jgi:hypothetical protein
MVCATGEVSAKKPLKHWKYLIHSVPGAQCFQWLIRVSPEQMPYQYVLRLRNEVIWEVLENHSLSPEAVA